MGDIFRSVGVLGAIVVALWLAGLLLTRTPESPVRPVDYAQIANSARQAAQYPLLAPRELPDGWSANGARFSPTDPQPWHLGVLTDQQRYIGLEQSTLSAQDMLELHADGSEPDGTVSFGGSDWQRFTGPDKRITLVEETEEVTTLVTTGTASMADVRRYLGLLAED